MSDTGWQALAAMVASLCSLLAAIFARQARATAEATSAKLDAHEEAAAARSAQVMANVAPAIRRPSGD